MLRFTAIVLLFLAAVPLLAEGDLPLSSAATAPSTIDAGLRDCFAKLLALGGYGRRAAERAAFVVATDHGGSECVVWPATNERKQARWDGSLPGGVVAIAHTHPRHLPDPSPHDLREAARTGLPIYVITPERVMVAAGSNAEVVVSGGWWEK